MTISLLRFLAMIVGPSITAAARPAMTFLAIQITVASLIYYELANLPDAFGWLVSIPAIVVAGVLALLEAVAKHDPDVDSVLQDLHIDSVTGAFGAFTSALLFSALGMPEAEAAAMIDGSAGLIQDSSNAFSSTASAAGSQHSDFVRGAAVAGAVGINVTLTQLRGRILAYIRDFPISKLWAWLETGGVLAILVLLPLIPLIVAGFLIVFVVVLTAVALGSRATAQAIDQRSRVPCENCGFELRVEASLCPECKTERVPTNDD